MRRIIIQIISVILYLSPVCLMAQIIQNESFQSLFVQTMKDGKPVTQGTGFVIQSKSKKYYLITNWHVVTNKYPWNSEWADTNKIEPNEIYIKHRSPKGMEWYFGSIEKLINNSGDILYKQFKIENEMADVVAIPLQNVSEKDIKFYPIDYETTYDDVYFKPADLLTVVGYPLGFSSALDFPIWKSGTIASEPDLNQENKPIIWVDMLGFGGMSGSPVFYITDNLITKTGSMSYGTRRSFFMGIFSHGKNGPQIGALWKSTYLKELFKSLE